MIAARFGKIPTTSVRRRISLLRRSCGLLDQIWRQISWGNTENASRSSRASSRCVAASGKRASIASTTRPYWSRTAAASGWSKDGPHHGRHPRLRRARYLGQQVAQVVGTAPLPGGTGQRGGDRVDQAAVGVGDDQPHPGQAPGRQRPQEPVGYKYSAEPVTWHSCGVPLLNQARDLGIVPGLPGGCAVNLNTFKFWDATPERVQVDQVGRSRPEMKRQVTRSAV